MFSEEDRKSVHRVLEELAGWQRQDDIDYWGVREDYPAIQTLLNEYDLLQMENKRLQEIGQHGCDCSPEDACEFARERDEAQAENAALRDDAALGAAVRRALEHSGCLEIKRVTYPPPRYDWLEQKPDRVEVTGWPIPDWSERDIDDDGWSNIHGAGETLQVALYDALRAAGLMEVGDGA